MGMGRDSLISVARQGLLLFPDLDYHEKQLWASCLRLAGVDASGIVNSDILEELAKAEPAAAQYWKFCRFFIQIFISDEPLLCKIEMAGWVLGYLASCNVALVHPKWTRPRAYVYKKFPFRPNVRRHCDRYFVLPVVHQARARLSRCVGSARGTSLFAFVFIAEVP